MKKHDTMSFEEAEERAWKAADEIIEEFENSDPSARDRLFTQSMLLLMRGHNIPTPAVLARAGGAGSDKE